MKYLSARWRGAVLSRALPCRLGKAADGKMVADAGVGRFLAMKENQWRKAIAVNNGSCSTHGGAN